MTFHQAISSSFRSSVDCLLRLSFQCGLLAIDCFLFIFAVYIDAKFAFKSAQQFEH